MEQLRISEVARRSGVSASTLRFYESKGLLPAGRSPNGYRVYGPEAVDRLAFIAQAKALDLPLSEVGELVAAWESGPCRQVRRRYRPLLQARLDQLAQRRAALDRLRVTIEAAMAHLEELPDREAACDADCSFLAPAPAPPPVDTAVACTLSGADYQDRVQHWHDLVAGAPHQPVDGGVRVTLPVADLPQAAALAAAEQACCPFYGFTLELHGATFELTVTAPAHAATLLADLLGTPAGSDR